MRTTINLDDDILDAARSLARQKGISLGEAVSELARRGLQWRGTPESGTKRGSNLPGFDVAEDAPAFGTADVKRALEEDES
ncbi:MAG: hypothetical protein ACLFP4_09070 [Spirochaetales bacterium]